MHYIFSYRKAATDANKNLKPRPKALKGSDVYSNYSAFAIRPRRSCMLINFHLYKYIIPSGFSHLRPLRRCGIFQRTILYLFVTFFVIFNLSIFYLQSCLLVTLLPCYFVSLSPCHF